ncbi:uncharacterized protein aknad1 [Leucoraja erinacea]|uniref:uncharacterized protein aknad1 n=1 Tax=Leucoraja erinaceus TaxID=7782 RepID=UPI002454686F|nr:uncharacterized protein aknad1 [Leucoraja erinacea]
MECFKEGMNLDSTDESDAKASEDILEKMDDYQFVRYVENHCINLQNSLGITEDELNEQGTKNPLLWEKSFEHEILLDVDDDFNLNFNDVCDSYIICLSQSSAEDVGFNIAADAVYKIENEHVESDEDKRIKTENINYEHHQEIHCSIYSDILDETKSNLEGNNCQDTAANISDEEQEELPYDGNLKNVSGHNTDTRIDSAGHLPPLSNLVGNLSGHGSTGEISQNIPLGDQRSIVKKYALH